MIDSTNIVSKEENIVTENPEDIPEYTLFSLADYVKRSPIMPY